MIPPQVLKLEPVALGPDVQLESDRIEVVVVIDPAGRAQLDDPLAAGPLRRAIEQTLAQGTFRPAEREGTPVAARVRMTLRMAPVSAAPSAPAEPAAVSGSVRAPTPAQAAAAATPAEEPLAYGARGRVALIPPTGRSLQLEEMRDLPGSFGDPFRVLDALPGVVPVFSGLPYVYVRGSPPAGTIYYYDGIQVPVLFHLALGPAVVHPALISGVDFFASVAPARYGRYTGGVLSGSASRVQPSAAHGELELRLIDVMGMYEAPVGEAGSITVAGRYGYPGLILSALSPDALLAYWDYQTRVSLPLGPSDRFELVWLGSFDRAGSKDSSGDDSTITLEFHRAELRLIRNLGDFEFGSALQLGYERSQIDDGLQVEAARIGPRMYALWRGSKGLSLRIGGDLFGTVGELRAPINQDSAQVEINVPLYADVAARSMAGLFSELSLPLGTDLTLDLGLRGDLWLTGSRGEVGVDPRVSLTWRSQPGLEWHVAGGLGHQPSVYLIPLPGIADVGLDYGLQEAIQSEFGAAVDLPAQLRLESQFYLQRLTNVILPDLALDQSDECDLLPSEVAEIRESCQDYPRASAWAYGWELFLRRDPSEALSGWLSYTLGWAEARAEEGFDFTPSFDVRHVANLVLQYRLGGGWQAGLRLHFRTGKMANMTFVRAGPIRYEQRLPAFFRTDVQLSYAWATNWGKLRVSLEFFNATLSREATNIRCRDGVEGTANPIESTPCPVTYAPALFFPNLGMRAEF